MSAFGIGTNAERADSGLLAGRQIKIACKAWFTSTGAIQPLSFKFEGDDGMMQTVNHVAVRFGEEVANNELIFYPEEGRWVMVLPE